VSLELAAVVLFSQFKLIGLKTSAAAVAASDANCPAAKVMVSSAMVSSVLAGLGEHLSTVMIWGGAVSNQSPIAATFSRIVSRVLCFCELLSTVIIWGGAVSNHEELIPDLVLPISLSLSLSLSNPTTHSHPSAQKCGVRSLAPFDISGVKNKNWKTQPKTSAPFLGVPQLPQEEHETPQNSNPS
jgi:hypothetical protein